MFRNLNLPELTGFIEDDGPTLLQMRRVEGQLPHPYLLDLMRKCEAADQANFAHDFKDFQAPAIRFMAQDFPASMGFHLQLDAVPLQDSEAWYTGEGEVVERPLFSILSQDIRPGILMLRRADRFERLDERRYRVVRYLEFFMILRSSIPTRRIEDELSSHRSFCTFRTERPYTTLVYRRPESSELVGPPFPSFPFATLLGWIREVQAAVDAAKQGSWR